MDPLRAFFEHLAQEWDTLQESNRDEILNQLLQPYDALFHSCDTLLEVGTGTGAMIPILKSRYPGMQITSIDLATAMLSRARQRYRDAFLVQANVHHLPIIDGHFSAVLCHNSFPHFWYKTEALRELRRILQPKGLLFILHEQTRDFVNQIHQNADADIIHQDILPTGAILEEMLEITGYHALSIEDNHLHYTVSARVR